MSGRMGSVWKINSLAFVAGFLCWYVILLSVICLLAHTARVCKQHRQMPNIAGLRHYSEGPRCNTTSCFDFFSI